jgi:hypothetical protein
MFFAVWHYENYADLAFPLQTMTVEKIVQKRSKNITYQT